MANFPCYVQRMKEFVKRTVDETRKDSAARRRFVHTKRPLEFPSPSSDVSGIRSSDLTVAVQMSQ